MEQKKQNEDHDDRDNKIKIMNGNNLSDNTLSLFESYSNQIFSNTQRRKQQQQEYVEMTSTSKAIIIIIQNIKDIDLHQQIVIWLKL